METLIHAALTNAVIAAILAVIIAGLAVFLRRRPAVVHGLWVLVLVKFLAPSVLPVEVPWWRTSLEQPDRSASIGVPQVPPPQVAHLSETRDFAEDFLPEPLMKEPLSHEILPPTDESWMPASIDPQISFEPGLSVITWSWETIVGMIWLTGSLAWVVIAAIRIVRFQRVLRLAKPVDIEVQLRVRQLAERLGLSIGPSVSFVSAPIAPLLWALTQSPQLLIPRQLWERLNEEQRDTLLVHELAHLRRGDHWVRRLEMIVLAIYWWHPVVWWAQRQLREAEEQCCDAWVLRALPEAASNYAAALVETLAFLNHSRPALPLGASGIEPMRLLKRRLSMIVQGHPSRGISRLAFWSVVGLGLLLLPLLPVPAQQASNPGGDDEEQVQPQAPLGTTRAGLEAPLMKPPVVEGVPTGADRGEQIEAAKDQVDLMEAKLMIKRAELEEMEMRIRLAQRSFSRAEELYKKGFVTESALQKAQDEAELLPTQLPTKKAELKEVEIMLKQAQRRLHRLVHAEGTPPGRPGMRPGSAGMPGMMGPSGPPTMKPKKAAPMKAPGGLPAGGMPGPGASSGNALPASPPSGMPGKGGPSLPGAGGPLKGPPGLPGGPGIGPPAGGPGLPQGPGVGPPTKPPSDDAEGVVLEADSKSGLATISIGSDSGIKAGNQLEVYRLKPSPKYLGKIVILNTEENRAVGTLTDKRIDMLQKGDHVAARVNHKPDTNDAWKGKTVNLEVRNKPWSKVFEWLSEQTGMPVELSKDDMPTGIFTFIAEGPKPYTIPQVIDILNQSLEKDNFLLTQSHRGSFIVVSLALKNPVGIGGGIASSGRTLPGSPAKGESQESKARILELEQKVDQLLKQMDFLREELKKHPANFK